MTITTEQLIELLDARFGGVVHTGSHAPDGQCCALELLSVARGVLWTDDPNELHSFDLRPINDGPWSSDAARTEHMVRSGLLAAINGSMDWSQSRQARFAERIAVDTVREIIAELPGLSDGVQAQCRSATTPALARAAALAAADAAYDAAVGAAVNAAYAAAVNAAYAAAAATDAAWDGARAANSDDVLIAACRIWLRAAQESAE